MAWDSFLIRGGHKYQRDMEGPGEGGGYMQLEILPSPPAPLAS